MADFASELVIDGKTDANPYVFNLPDIDPTTGENPEYDIIPLLTVGDEVPLLDGEFGSFTASLTDTYAMAGIPDGLGFTQIGDLYYVFMNHELGSSVVTDVSSTVNGQINGARVSLYVFDQDWNAIGGKNLIEDAVIDGVTYSLNLTTGNYEDTSGNILTMTDHTNFSRFCSGYLATQGFVDENGNEIPIYFAPEEVGGGLGIPVTPDGTASPLRGLGVYSKEQVFAASQYRATNSEYTALISAEDAGDGEIYLYVGKQTADNPNGFTSNPDEFDLYVLQVVDPTIGTVFGFETMPENMDLISRWQLVPDDIALNADPAVLSSWVNATDASGMFRSTDFERPEDVHEDFSNPGTFYFVTTGTNDIPPGGTEAVNRFGMLHRFDLQLDANGVPLDGTFEFLMEGGPNTGVSYDNIVVDSNGNVVINEDNTAGGDEVLQVQQRNGRVVSYNIAHNENRVGNDEVTFLFELDQAAEGEQFDTSFGAWETSGIIEVPGGTNGQSAYLFDVQAPTIRNDSGVYEGRYERGGQLILVVPIEEPKIVGFASLPADTFAPGLPGGSGNAITTPDRTTPFDGQPVQGFSGVQFADDGSYWFLSDNGFGSKANSADYLLRVYKVDPNFKTEDGGTGQAEWTDFIQLSDPNNLIDWDIVQEGTSDRLLTGADFDPESIVITDDGTIWIGEEFGPYLLHFDSNGVLIDAPIATPNLFSFNTLSGEDPLVIAHRGASGDRPEHTLGFLGRDLIAAYNLAIEIGADFIEPDLVPTKDGVLIARHENALAIVTTDANGNPIIKENGEFDITEATTNVYLLPQFANRLTTKDIDGNSITGWFSEDFTLAEIKQLRAVERIPATRPDNAEYDFLFEIPTLGEIIDLVKFIEQTTGEKIGIYPETKHPTYFAEEGTFLDGTPINLNTSQILIDTLVEKGFTDPERIFIQSFEVGNLKALNDTIMPTAGVDIPLVQLLDAFSEAPYDFTFNGDTRTYADLVTAAGLAEIATYAEGIGPWKRTIIATDAQNALLPPTTLIEDAHAAGLQVHPYTFRDEANFLATNYNGNPEAEYDQFFSLGVDGLFSDNPATALKVLEKITADFVRSPDNPQGTDLVNLGRSRGFEGMAYSPDGLTLYPLLEGRVTGDPANALRIYEFDVASKTYVDELVGYYQLDKGDNAIGDFTPINDSEFLVIERDNLQGSAAQFKKVFKVDFSQIDSNGFVEKALLVDLLNLADPDDLNSDGSLVYTLPFQTIEDILVIDEKTILIANDNNYPFSKGRPPALDNNEMVLIELPEALDLASELGLPEVSLSATPATVEEGAQLTWNFSLAQPVPTGGLVINLDLTEATDPEPGDIEYNVTGSENITGFELVVEGGVIQGAKVTLAEGATSAKLVSNIIADQKTEGPESVTFTVAQGEGYRINSEANEASFTIEDTSTTPVPKRVSGSSGDDIFDTVDPGEKNFVGDNQLLFAGSGDDFVDVTFAPGGNRLDLGSGDDIVIAGTNNRILAGKGDDLIFVGTGGGDNLITGGLGADQFWIVTDEGDLPLVANTITDFKISEGDVIGFAATSLDFDALNLTQSATSTIVNALGKDLAILQNVQVSSLSADNFDFA